MKLDLHNPEHESLLTRYLSEEMEEPEKSLFEEDFLEDDENQSIVHQMNVQMKLIERFRENRKPDTLLAWERLHARIQKDENDSIPIKKTFSQNWMLKSAAILVFVLGISTVLFFILYKSDMNEKMVTINTDNEANTLIKTLQDGTIVYISSNSIFSFPDQFSTDDRTVILKGEAFFDVAHDPEKPFFVNTDAGKIKVLGTAFNVKVNGTRSLELSVVRGKVQIDLEDLKVGNELLLAGDRLLISPKGLSKTKIDLNEEAWYSSQMHFKDEALRNIVHVLNINFHTNFVIADQELGDRKLTVTFGRETPEAMTKLICLALNLKSEVRNDSIFLSAKVPGQSITNP
jgi:ferric-dicitrate binding protein FerR (iron transport regulator)